MGPGRLDLTETHHNLCRAASMNGQNGNKPSNSVPKKTTAATATITTTSTEAATSTMTSTTKTSTPNSDSRKGLTLAPLIEYLSQRLKINNNNNNTNNVNKECIPQSLMSNGDNACSKAVGRGGVGIHLFRSRRTKEKNSEDTVCIGNGLTQPKSESTSEQSNGRPEHSDNDVLCHGLLDNAKSQGHTRLLTHPRKETEASNKSTTENNAEFFNSPKEKKEAQCIQNLTIKDLSGSHEQVESTNNKLCKNYKMSAANSSTAHLQNQSESKCIPPIIEEAQEGSTYEPRVIEVFLPQRQQFGKEASGEGKETNVDANLQPQGSTRKNHKLNFILRRILNMTERLGKEDKQRLVDDEEDEDEEEQIITETKLVAEEKGELDTATTSKTGDNTTTDKKRQPGMKGLCEGLGRRVRRSLGRGCHYLEHSVLTITNYIPEVSYLGPMVPCKNYDGDYVYVSNDYMLNDYI